MWKFIFFAILIISFYGYSEASEVIDKDYEYGSENNSGSGIPVYPEKSCIGPVINGVCKGEILHPGPPKEKCYGQWLNGKCIGPQF
jgi:hypothetical protein